MNKLLAVLMLAPGLALAATPVRTLDGKVVFAKYDVGGTPAFTEDEKDYILKLSPDATVTTLTPSRFEVALSTSGIRLSRNEFEKAVDDRGFLTDKLDDLKPS